MIRKGDFKKGDLILVLNTNFQPKKYCNRIWLVTDIHKSSLHFESPIDVNEGCYLYFDDVSEVAVLASKAMRVLYGIN